ncbi:MAG TPA: hypothetical protein VIF62_02180, partial [Labilithrix sp.]
MFAFVRRLAVAFLGASAATLVVALLETRSAAAEGVSSAALMVAEIGILLPIPILMVFACAGLIVFELLAYAPIAESFREQRAARDGRLRAAAVAPLSVLAFFAWVIGSAHVAAAGLGWPTRSAPAVGLGVAVGSVGLAAALTAVCLALLPVTVRGFREIDRVATQLADPRATGAIAFASVALFITLGVVTGDSGGVGGAPGVGIFGVLRRPELDLRGMVELLFVLGAGYATSVVVGRGKPATTTSA